MMDDLVPNENMEAYKYFYMLETGLRELIIQSLESYAGHRWVKQRIPPDIRGKFNESVQRERTVKWTQLIPHHPIYYIDFPDLSKIIGQSDNWRDVFGAIFKDKNIITAHLFEIEVVRNKVAHNRKLSESDLSLVKAAYTVVTSAIGERRFRELVLRNTSEIDLIDHINLLKEEAQRGFSICKGCGILANRQEWEAISTRWWFDDSDSYLGQPLVAVRALFAKLEEYGKLPRERGNGYKIEAWVKGSNLDTIYTQAMAELTYLLDQAR